MTPDMDYPDRRDQAQRRSDGRRAAAQSQALTDSNTNPRRADEMIRRLQAERERAQGSENPPFLFDVIPPDAPDRAHPVLVVRNQLLLRDPTPPPGPEHADRGDAGGDTDAYQQAVQLLGTLGYRPQLQRDHRRDALPFQSFDTQDKDGAELVRNRDQVRAATGADVDLNYVCVTGHTVKDEDTPVLSAADPAFPPAGVGTEQIFRPVTVAVIDTGINRDERTDGWLASIAETAQNEDLLDVLPADGILDASAGHGTFVCGVLQQVAPQCTVVVYRKADTDGMATVQDIGNAMVQAAADGADIISVSLGTTTVDNQPPALLLSAMQTLQAQYPDVLVVASAGNNGTDTPVFPGAVPGVKAVAALNPDLTPAPWSSFGPWVTCSAVGVGIASTFVPGEEQEADGSTQKFGPNAWAIWSGTSFSAPQIAAAVARLAQISPAPITPAAALTQLLQRYPTLAGYGPLVGLLPGS